MEKASFYLYFWKLCANSHKVPAFWDCVVSSSHVKGSNKASVLALKPTKGFFFRCYFKVSARSREEAFTEAPEWKKRIKFVTTVYQPLHFSSRRWICTVMTSPKTSDCHRLKRNTTFQHVSCPDAKAFSPIWDAFKVDISSIFYLLSQIFFSRFLVLNLLP